MLSAAECRTILGVSASSSKAEIRRAYLRLAKNVHPDKNKAADATVQFQRISAAYQHLSSDECASDSDGGPGAAGQPCLDDVYAACDVFNEAVYGLVASLDVAFHPDQCACAPERLSSPDRVSSPDFHSESESSAHADYAHHRAFCARSPTPTPPPGCSAFYQDRFFHELADLCDQEELRSRSPSPGVDASPAAWAPPFSSCLRKRPLPLNLEAPSSEEVPVKHIELESPLHASLRFFCAPTAKITAFYRGLYPLVLKCNC